MHWYNISNSFYWYHSIFNCVCSVIVFAYIEKELKSHQTMTSTLTTMRNRCKPFSLFYIYIISHISKKQILFANFYMLFILSIASIVFSLLPNAVSLKYPSPLGPKPTPGVPTTFAFSNK